MKHLTILKLLFILFSFESGNAQNCECSDSFSWLKQTMEGNDAGFTYAVEPKRESYDLLVNTIEEKAKETIDSDSCLKLLREYLALIRKGHLSINKIYSSESKENSKEKGKWEEIAFDLDTFKKYLENKKEKDLEGIWMSDPYTIGVQKIGKDYIGFIMESKNESWKEGQVKLRIKEDGTSVYYMGDFSPVNIKSSELIKEDYLKMDRIKFKRLYPVPKANKELDLFMTSETVLERLDKKTIVLRITSFNYNNKKRIDSLLVANKKELLKTQNLIIDIRDSGGGSDSSYSEIIPYLYTNPIRTIGVQLYSTKLNNQRLLRTDMGFNPEWAKKTYETLEKKIGEFVMLNKYPVTLTTYDKVYKYPENVAIIINNNNGSTDEQFLLAAKQSRKVKLYGVTTAGVLDISNMNFVSSPCEKYELGYGLSKSLRIPNMAIDGKGIQPDYYLDESIPKEEWLGHVRELLE